MRTVMLTPLFPPDTSESATYAKLLAERLQDLALTVVAYGKLPESVSETEIISIDKSGLKIVTVLRCLETLKNLKPSTLLIHNGPSTDLPAALYKLIYPSVQLIYIESDIQAVNQKKSLLTGVINREVKKRADAIVTLLNETSLFLPPEILPFEAVDSEIEITQDHWWSAHIQLIKSYVT